MSKQERQEAFEMHCTAVKQIVSTKNEYYDESFYRMYKRFGNIAALIPMHNKLERIERLMSWKREQPTESIVDSLRDLAGYALLTASIITTEQTGGAPCSSTRKL